jgi:hypothetical protein
MIAISYRSAMTAVAASVFVTCFTSSTTHCAADPVALFKSDGKALSDVNKVLYQSNVVGYETWLGPELGIVDLPIDWPKNGGIFAHTGTSAMRFSGSGTGGASTFCCMQAFNVNITVTSKTKLSYWIYPQYENSRFEKVDLHCTDGSTLHGVGGVYTLAQTDAPSHQRGQLPINVWSEITCNVGQVLNGKTVDAIWIVYDRAGSYGQFRGYIEDIDIVNTDASAP